VSYLISNLPFGKEQKERSDDDHVFTKRQSQKLLSYCISDFQSDVLCKCTDTPILLSHLIPLVLILLPIVMTFFLMVDFKLAVVPLVLMIIGLPFYWQIISLSLFSSNDKIGNKGQISVLSYNAKLFRMPDTYSKFSLEMIDWVVEEPSDIKCIQEFSTNSHWPVLDAEKMISDRGYHSFIHTVESSNAEHNSGMAIFSKFKICDAGYVWNNKQSINAGIFADIVSDQDTIRVYNVHLASMSLESYTTINLLPMLLQRLKNGSLKREQQIEKLIDHVEKCPYPFIVCGDFNETPYSYNLRQINEKWANTFEAVGKGFGYTYNIKWLPIRIDHQFHSEMVMPLSLEVDQSMGLSDHFPLKGTYAIKP
jgi:endonuclease/exonuclease/phosphatase family metal-dependent hydrolase